jgi:very-short-patch-repair endonuclease
MKKGREINLARQLRRSSTDAEKILWNRLRMRQLEDVKFRRQQPLGPYIIDLISFDRKLIIEIDGGQHNQQEKVRSDEERTDWLKEKGYRILRFWNNEVLENIDGVLERIREGD